MVKARAVKVKGIIALILVVAIAFGGLMLFGVISFAPKFDNLDGTWMYVTDSNSDAVIKIDSKEKTVNCYTEDGTEMPLFGAKQIRYHSPENSSHPTFGEYSKICFNTGATIGSSYTESDSFVFYPMGETVMWVQSPKDAESVVPSGIYRKCSVKVFHDDETDTNELVSYPIYKLDGVVELNEDNDWAELLGDAKLDALVGEWSYVSGSYTMKLDIKKSGEDHIITDGTGDYTIETANFLSKYRGINITAKQENGFKKVFHIIELTDGHMTFKTETDDRDIFYCKKS